jgi:hypothetical protein
VVLSSGTVVFTSDSRVRTIDIRLLIEKGPIYRHPRYGPFPHETIAPQPYT